VQVLRDQAIAVGIAGLLSRVEEKVYVPEDNGAALRSDVRCSGGLGGQVRVEDSNIVNAEAEAGIWFRPLLNASNCFNLSTMRFGLSLCLPVRVGVLADYELAKKAK
jgi:hypothetical protein